MPNVDEKSVIYAPFNTTLKSELQNTQLQTLKRELSLGNVVYRTKVREANRAYEFNNNGEVDNGLLINQQKSSAQSQTQREEEDLFKPQPLQRLISDVPKAQAPQVSLVTEESGVEIG